MVAGSPFEVDYVSVWGDATGDGLTNPFDLNAIFGNQGAAPDDSPFDINGDSIVNPFDINASFGAAGSFAPAKPTGPSCP